MRKNVIRPLRSKNVISYEKERQKRGEALEKGSPI